MGGCFSPSGRGELHEGIYVKSLENYFSFKKFPPAVRVYTVNGAKTREVEGSEINACEGECMKPG